MENKEYYMSVFSKNLRYYMDLRGKTQTDIIRDLNINKSSISTWVNGTRIPRMDKVDLLAKYLGISRSDLIEDHGPEVKKDTTAFVPSSEEKDMLALYRGLDNIDQAKIQGMIQLLLTDEKYKKEGLKEA